MVTQGIEAIVIDLGYNLNPVALPTEVVVEVLFLKNESIFKIPLSKPPFIGITLLRKETIPLLDLKDIIFSDINYDFKEEYINKNAFILLTYKGTRICFRINSIVGYFHLTDISEEEKINFKSESYISSIYSPIEGETTQSVYLLDISKILGNITSSKTEVEQSSQTEETEGDVSQFSIPEDEDDLDIDQFTLPE